jgi:O-antigen ligase
MSDRLQMRTVEMPAEMPVSEFRSHWARILATAETWLLIGILALSPLPLGSARPLPWSMLALAVGVLLLVALCHEAIDPSPKSRLRPLLLPLLLASLVFVWIVVQLLPSNIALSSEPIWSMAQNALGTTITSSISVDRAQTAAELLQLLTYTGVFLASWRATRESEGAWLVMRAVGWIGTVYALYGLVNYSLGNQTILWLPKWAYRDDLTGSFVNRNSFATFLGLSLVCNFAALIELFARQIDPSTRRTQLLSAIEAIFSKGRWVAASLVIVAGALLLTHSRGGSIATFIGIAMLLLIVMRARGFYGAWRKPLAITSIVGAVIVAVAGGTGVLTRFSNDSFSADARNDVYVGTIAAIREHSLYGTGLGTFEFVYPAYQSPHVSAFFDLAHEDYLENTLELGIPVALAFYATLALLIGQCAVGVFRRRRDMIYPAIAVSASTLVGVHALVDFSLQIPAVAVLYAALLGMGLAQSASTARRRDLGPSHRGGALR